VRHSGPRGWGRGPPSPGGARARCRRAQRGPAAAARGGRERGPAALTVHHGVAPEDCVGVHPHKAADVAGAAQQCDDVGLRPRWGHAGGRAGGWASVGQAALHHCSAVEHSSSAHAPLASRCSSTRDSLSARCTHKARRAAGYPRRPGPPPQASEHTLLVKLEMTQEALFCRLALLPSSWDRATRTCPLTGAAAGGQRGRARVGAQGGGGIGSQLAPTLLGG
jgi:hypothetical protein